MKHKDYNPICNWIVEFPPDGKAARVLPYPYKHFLLVLLAQVGSWVFQSCVFVMYLIERLTASFATSFIKMGTSIAEVSSSILL